MKTLLRRFVKPSLRNVIAAAHDTAMAGLSFVLALYLRLGAEDFHQTRPYLLHGALIFTALSLSVFIGMRLYRGLWRYASLPDLVALTRAVSMAVAGFTLLMFILTRLEGVPRSLPFILWLLLLFLLGAPRFLYRALKDRTLAFRFRDDASKRIPVLLAGATGSAELFIRECARNPDSPYRVTGLIDERLNRQQCELLGVRIFGGLSALPEAVRRLALRGLKPQRLILADENADGAYTRKLLEAAQSLGMIMGRLPRISELRDGGEAPDILPIALEDLLGRAQTVHDKTALRTLVEGRRVSVTGAGGSIGAELARQLAGFNPASLILIELSEYALYRIDMELANSHPDLPRHAVLADVRDAVHMDVIFAEHRPELVFHAAAIKHVPLSEQNPLEAVRTNVFGTCCVARVAAKHGALAMVLISTDKAVRPANIMGATKRLAERCMQAGASSGGSMRFLAVRFGNVLGSTGSVVPLFRRQLKAGGPLTVTHPDMVRYFMTIREAVELVIAGAALGLSNAEDKSAIFVLDMGTPMRIADLAKQMIRLSGAKAREAEIVYTGLRPGEKLFEELFYDEEAVKRTETPGILTTTAGSNLPAEFNNMLAALEEHCKERRSDEALALLKALVPEYNPNP